MASKRPPVLQVEQIFDDGSAPAIAQSLFDPSAPVHAGETSPQPTAPAECAGQLQLTEES